MVSLELYASNNTETTLIMPHLAHATTATFLDPNPDGPIHEYTSIRCLRSSPDPKRVFIEIPIDAHPLNDHGFSRAPPIAPGWEVLISDSRGDILIDGHVGNVTHSPAASVYTID